MRTLRVKTICHALLPPLYSVPTLCVRVEYESLQLTLCSQSAGTSELKKKNKVTNCSEAAVIHEETLEI